MDDNARTGELRRKLEKDPGSRLFAQLAEELRKDGKLDEAISVARKGLEKNANYPSARLTLARALLDSGRPQEARPELEQIVKASPDNIMASRLLGEALEAVGDLEMAMKQFERTLLVSPGDKAVLEKIAQLKPRLTPVPAAPAIASPAPASPPPPAAETMPPSALPSVFEDPVPAVSFVEPVLAVATPPPSVMALDRDLASGTFSPGSLNAADLQKHFEETAATEAQVAAPAVEVHPAVGVGEMQVAVAETLPPRVLQPPATAVAELADDLPDVGAQTLPLSSMTLADLYLQQGLKAEASAVLSQVMKEEPENIAAKSRFAAVSGDLAAAVPTPEATPEAASRAVLHAPRSRAEVRDRSIASLKLFASAVEREAQSQRATERGVF